MYFCPQCRTESGASYTGVIYTLCPRCRAHHGVGIHAIESGWRRACRNAGRSLRISAAAMRDRFSRTAS